MSEQTTHLFDRAVSGAAEWLDDLAAELGTDDPRHARRVLRAVLHALRDRMIVNEAAQFGAQLPELIRGMYYEEWVPGRHSPRHVKGFLETVARTAGLNGPTEASYAVAATMRVVRRHVSGGEIDDVIAEMPSGMRGLLTPA